MWLSLIAAVLLRGAAAVVAPFLRRKLLHLFSFDLPSFFLTEGRTKEEEKITKGISIELATALIRHDPAAV